jgi:hypothetical protein
LRSVEAGASGLRGRCGGIASGFLSANPGGTMKKLLFLLIIVVIGVAVARKLREA